MTTNVYQTVTDKIVSAIEKGAGTWTMPWHKLGTGSSSQPVNVDGRRYRGSNVISLWCESMLKGYSDSVWGTYKSWQEKGGQVRKSEKGTMVVFWKSYSSTVTGENGEESEEKHLVARGYSVFNVSQVDGYKPKTKPIVERPLIERINHAERFFDKVPVPVNHGGDRAYYIPSVDRIQLPEFQQFVDPESYYATRGHESIHSTGHKSRLDRNLSGRFGSESYGMEELIAELGSAMLACHLGIENEPRPDHAAYLSSWLRVLKTDARAIFTVSSRAQAGVDWLISAAGESSVDDDELAMAA